MDNSNLTADKNVLLTQNPTKIPFDIENQRFSFHCLWQTRNTGSQGRAEWGIDGTIMLRNLVFMFQKISIPGWGYIAFQSKVYWTEHEC